MFSHYMKTALRYLLRNRGLTIINILGLAIGICVFVLIMHYVRNELCYDKFINKPESVGRLEFKFPEGQSAWTTSAMGYDVAQAVPEVRAFLRIRTSGDWYLDYEEHKYHVPSVIWADSNFFDFFNLKMIAGNPATALREPATVVLTESMAKKIFRDESPLGKVLKTSDGKEFRVTGIIADPTNFHLQFDMILSFVTLGMLYGEERLYTYKTTQYITYLETEGMVDPDTVNRKINTFWHEKFRELGWGEDEDEGEVEWTAWMRPVRDVYFARGVDDTGTRHGNRQFVYLFILIAVFIILIACINFINISTARAAGRAMEVGIKKVSGSGRNRLIAQFLSESLLVTLFATLLGLLLVELVFPAFENIVGEDLRIAYLENPVNLLFILAGIVLLGGLSGLYPAFYLTAFKPVSVLKGEKTRGRTAGMLRKILIVFQFTISVVLIIGTIVVYRQLQYLRIKDLGFNKENVITVGLDREVREKREAFRQNLLKHPQIEMVSYSYTVPGGSDNYEGFTFEGKSVDPCVYQIDPDYVSLMGMKLKEGRDFSWDLPSEKASSCLINETLARELNKDSLVGRFFDHPDWYITAIPSKKIEILGILKDFHYKSLRQEIEPLMLVWNDGWYGYANIRISPGTADRALDAIQKEWKAISPEYPLEYTFMDENFDRMYRTDRKLGSIFRYFAGLAILIAIMGLFGLSAFIAEQRTREIGIRKAMGATISGVSLLLVKEFTWLILIASVIAWTLAWLWARNWLREFAYHMDLNLLIFLAATMLALAIAWITVLFQTLKAASTNPADALRYE